MYQLFKAEIQEAKKHLVEEKSCCLAGLPRFAGQALMIRLKKRHLTKLMKVFSTIISDLSQGFNYIRIYVEIWIAVCSQCNRNCINMHESWYCSHHLKLSSLILLIKHSVFCQILDDAQWMPPCAMGDEVRVDYEKLIVSMDDIVRALYQQWNDSMDTNISARLDRPLMIRSHTRPGLLESNFDR